MCIYNTLWLYSSDNSNCTPTLSLPKERKCQDGQKKVVFFQNLMESNKTGTCTTSGCRPHQSLKVFFIFLGQILLEDQVRHNTFPLLYIQMTVKLPLPGHTKRSENLFESKMYFPTGLVLRLLDMQKGVCKLTSYSFCCLNPSHLVLWSFWCL